MAIFGRLFFVFNLLKINNSKITLVCGLKESAGLE